MKIFQWVGEQFTNNFFNMALYTASVLIVGWFTGPLVPGVNGVIAKMVNKHVNQQ